MKVARALSSPQFIAAPNYTGNIDIGFIQSAQPYWPAVAISHLPNGIHGVQYYANGSWVPATMDSPVSSSRRGPADPHAEHRHPSFLWR
jgi:hypothetical protein